jgi:DNA-binding MarR family transcriptional regulator
MTLSELAQAHGVDAPYATVIVDKLELLGLVERQGHPDDHRRKLVALTLAGSDAIATADAILLQPPTAMQELTEAELNRLEELLSRIGEAPAQPEQDGPAP